MYNKAKVSKKKKDWEHYNYYNRETTKSSQSSKRWNYINKILLTMKRIQNLSGTM